MARKRREKVEISGDEEQLVSFKLGKGTFAVKVANVREIVKVQDITRIPKMPDYVEGVMNLRGQITTVIDLKKRFNIETGEDMGRTAQSRIIVAEIGDNQLGIVVDAVEDVMRVPLQSISAPPKTLSSGVDTAFLTGICKMPDKLIMLLDLNNLIESEEEREKLLGVNNEGAKGEVA
ncbi:MAG: purine-binding chemotaxis protein [Methanomassiliicoccales archaeon PtaU1.Bin124]|nr:MAG: purine-binding chemotaxis protein [Methanomassiliicoccales archaeon PtaU1.Bin124]